MRRKLRFISGCFTLAAVSAMAAVPAAKGATLTETVDHSTITDSYINVFNATGTTYMYGYVGAIATNPATFSGDNLTLAPNTDLTDNATPPNAPGTLQVHASTYAENTTSGGNTVTFNFTVAADSLAPTYSVLGFVADFTTGFAQISEPTVAITGPGNYTVSDPITAGDIVQYGFTLTGANAADAVEPLLGSITITPTVTPEPATLGLVGMAGAMLIRRRRTA